VLAPSSLWFIKQSVMVSYENELQIIIAVTARTWIIMEALVSLWNLCSLRAAIARNPVCITIADSYTWRYAFLAEWARACFCILIEAASLLIYSKSFLASLAAGFYYIIRQFQVRTVLLTLMTQSAQSSEEIPLQNFWDLTEALRKLMNSFRIRCVFIRLWISRAALTNTSARRASSSAIWPALKNTFVFPIWYKQHHMWDEVLQKNYGPYKIVLSPVFTHWHRLPDILSNPFYHIWLHKRPSHQSCKSIELTLIILKNQNTFYWHISLRASPLFIPPT
jgi:hypothetical protein